MVLKPVNDGDLADKYIFHRKAGKSLIETRPIFSPEGDSIALIVENVVRVYNIETGDCARTLETETHVNQLIAIEFTESDNYNLYGCSEEGRVIVWTWANGAVLREINLKLPFPMKVVTFNLLDNNDCFIIAESSTPHAGTYSMKTGELIHSYTILKKTSNIIKVAIGWCNGDKYAAVVNGTKTLFIQNLYKPHINTRIANQNNLRILSVAAHKTENAVAITDTLGRAIIFRGDLFDYRKVAREMLHWHFLPLLAVAFSSQGSYLYTGGIERVLLKWTVATLASKSGEKIFIPRLPGLIRFIATSNTHVAVTLSNNSVVVANAQMRVISTILECGGLSPAARAIGASLVYHKAQQALLMGGRTGHLQLYSTVTDKLLFNVDITGMENIPPTEDNLIPVDTEVTCVAINAKGTWLATSEYRNDGITYPEERLKFWRANPNPPKLFVLNTCAVLSHGGFNIVSLAFNDKAEFCVSAGTDQMFRIWKRHEVSSVEIRNKTITEWEWTCFTACYYSSGVAHCLSDRSFNNFKVGMCLNPDADLSYRTDIETNDVIQRIFDIHKDKGVHKIVDPALDKKDEHHMGGVAISQDGSLIAAWFGCKLTLWDTKTYNLHSTLAHPALRPVGCQVHFGNGDAAHYLACTTQSCLAVWSLLSMTITWLVPNIYCVQLVADPFSNKMALLTLQNDVHIFTPHSSKPILTKKRLLDPKTGGLKHCVFGSSTSDDVCLYLTRNDNEIYCLERADAKREHSAEILSRQARAHVSKFGALLAEQSSSEVRAAPFAPSALPELAHASHAAQQFISAAPHMLPPVSLMCTSFLQQISGHQSQEDAIEEEDNAMEVDQADSSDDEQKNPEIMDGNKASKPQLWAPNYDQVKEKRLRKIQKQMFLDLHATSDIFGV